MRSNIKTLNLSAIKKVFDGFILSITEIDPPSPFVNQQMTIKFSVVNVTMQVVSGEVRADSGEVVAIPNLGPSQIASASILHTPKVIGRGQTVTLTFTVPNVSPPHPPKQPPKIQVNAFPDILAEDVAVFDVRTDYILEVNDAYSLPLEPGWPQENKWNAAVCLYTTSFADLSADKPMEWTPVIGQDEIGGNVAVSGTVCSHLLSGDDPNDFSRDMPFLHPFYNDWDMFVAVDEPFYRLLAPTQDQGSETDPSYQDAIKYADANGISYPKGFMGIEIQRGFVTADYRATEGQRVAMLGRWIVDCGHDNFTTEIHEPLLLAIGYREQPPIDQAFSVPRTTIKLISRPFMVSQIINGHGVLPAMKLGFAERLAEAHLDLLFPPLLAEVSPIALRPTIVSPPFRGIESLPLTMRPPVPRPSPAHVLHASYHFTVRSGVSIVVGSTPSADEIVLTVWMDEGGYKPMNPPAPHNVNVPWDGEKSILASLPQDKRSDLNKLFGLTTGLDFLVKLVYDKGFDTDRYDLAPPGGEHDFENLVYNAVVTTAGVASSNSGYVVDDNQPYPIYGWMTLEWVDTRIIKRLDPRVWANGPAL
jgi:hypothetical protein